MRTTATFPWCFCSSWYAMKRGIITSKRVRYYEGVNINTLWLLSSSIGLSVERGQVQEIVHTSLPGHCQCQIHLRMAEEAIGNRGESTWYQGSKADVCLMSCTCDLSRYWYEYSAVQPCDGVSLVPTESDVPRRLLGYDLGRLFRMAEGTPTQEA